MVEETAAASCGRVDLCYSVVYRQLVVKEDRLRLVGTPGVQFLQQVAVEGCRLPREKAVEERKVPSVREESVNGEELCK